ncbi:hypothetical protein ACIG87_23900 [Micromonospora sp. NPDC051925]|uniref:hypothetical protein n=1 Tax=Micromonospora sp. NPDC051925 TaxID=3364288 RepID=UPI0037C89BD9
MPHRVLLAAFPARIRRRHGAELITTLAEMTDGRPSHTDRLRLIADGVRERFRLPARRPLDVLTMAAAVLVGGAIGLAAGSLAGEQTYPSMPATAPLAAQILGPQAQPDRLHRDRFYLEITQNLGAATTSSTLEQQVHAVHDRLAATGWDVTAVERYRSLDQWSFSARSHGLRVSVTGYADPNRPIEVLGYPVRPATYLPLVFGGLLVGLLAGWLVGAAMAHRLTASRHRVPAVVVGAVGVAILAAPTGRLYQGLLLFLRKDNGFLRRDIGAGVDAPVHDALAWMPWPLRDPATFPDTVVPGLRTLLIGLAITALAAAIAHRPRGGDLPVHPELPPGGSVGHGGDVRHHAVNLPHA